MTADPLGSDIAIIDVRGSAEGDIYHFVGASPQMPGAVFRSVMTPIEDEIMPAMDAVGEGGIINGLYSVHIRLLDGGLTGVMLIHDGRILGGDAFYYLGTHISANGRWKGQILNQEHTPAKGEHPIFGGYEVGIGFSGTCDERNCTGRQAQPSLDRRAEADAPGLALSGFARNAMAQAGVQR